MKLKKLLTASIFALSSLSFVVAPVMASPMYNLYTPCYSVYGPTIMNTSLGNANVKLGSVEWGSMVAANHNGGGSVYHYKLTFLVRNCGYDKNIVVHHQVFDDSNEWADSEPAKYVKTLSDGTEIWELDITAQAGTQFCVWYKEVDSWDNNNGANYQF